MKKLSNKDYVQVPLQSVTKSGKTIFAYLRRSTTKKEQEESLMQQEDGIDSIVKKLWYEKEDIRYFAETYSGFENKKRKQWGQMIQEIDKSKESCIILTRDMSRLSRNPTDSQGIMDRLYGDNKSKRKIEKIYCLDYDNIKEWSIYTDKEDVHRSLSASYYDSLDTKRKSIQGILLKLEDGQFPYTAPKGLESVRYKGKRILKQNEKMPFIERAFIMKTEGKTHKEISKYLKQHGDIKLSDKELTERLFKYTVYIWSYIEKTTGLYYEWLKFLEWKPPISISLWEKVQNCLGRKISQYGEKQEGDILAEKLRTGEGRRMSRYLAKNKYPNYKNTIEKIHISEVVILKEFINYMESFLRREQNIFLDELRIRMTEFLLFEIEKARMDEEVGIKRGSSKGAVDIIFNKFEYIALETLNKIPVEIIESIIKSSPLFIKLQWDKNIKSNQIEKLKKQKEEIEEERKKYRRNAIKMGYSREEVEEVTKDMEKDIKYIESKIHEFSDDTDTERYIGRLPEILSKTFELTGNTIQRAKDEDTKEDIIKLLELTTFELTISNKKELKVKLFDVLDKLLSDDKSVLEAPPGVEPGYGALQAPT